MTNYVAEKEFQHNFPHTANAATHLICSMADAYNMAGKKTWFGNDRGLKAYKKFEEKLKDAILSLVLDGVIDRNATAPDVRIKLVELLQMMVAIYPNWQDAYSFANVYFIQNADSCEKSIERLMR